MEVTRKIYPKSFFYFFRVSIQYVYDTIRYDIVFLVLSHSQFIFSVEYSLTIKTDYFI